MAGEGPINVIFDPARFDLQVEQLGNYLAELKYIDAALSYVDQRHVRAGAGPGPRYDWLYITLGQGDYEFRRMLGRYVMPPGYVAQVRSDLAELAEEARIWADREIETMRFLTKHITYPTPEAHDFLAGELEIIRDEIDRINKDLGKLSDNVSRWTGRQAESFAAFQQGHQDVVDHQYRFVFALRDAVAASKAITLLSQHSLASAVVATRDAAHEQLRKRSLDHRGASKAEVLRIASAATGILAVIGFKMPPLAAGLAGISVSLDFAASTFPERAADTYDIEGSTAEELSASLFDSIGQITASFTDHFYELDTELRKLDPNDTDDQGKRLYFHARPDLADGLEPEQFQYLF